MKDPKDEYTYKIDNDKNAESFAYSEGIGDPDRQWKKKMIIDDNPPSKNKEISDDELPIGDEENTNLGVEPHEKFIEEDEPLNAEKPYELDPNLGNMDNFK